MPTPTPTPLPNADLEDGSTCGGRCFVSRKQPHYNVRYDGSVPPFLKTATTLCKPSPSPPSTSTTTTTMTTPNRPPCCSGRIIHSHPHMDNESRQPPDSDTALLRPQDPQHPRSHETSTETHHVLPLGRALRTLHPRMSGTRFLRRWYFHHNGRRRVSGAFAFSFAHAFIQQQAILPKPQRWTSLFQCLVP
ncbi:hypothetical protein ColTof4_14420 [Colletotrichum tofieldiae]|nr:hypothetical protein ColTof3_14860 [Colletotrichum tofieldiae]GKT81997.1 hypothetical protein ColTof4_14420 [Colletotrichum tofieldiae]